MIFGEESKREKKNRIRSAGIVADRSMPNRRSALIVVNTFERSNK
jgi:hypothetical protein